MSFNPSLIVQLFQNLIVLKILLKISVFNTHYLSQNCLRLYITINIYQYINTKQKAFLQVLNNKLSMNLE